MCCYLLSVRENKAAQLSSFQSICKAAVLWGSGWCAQSFLCQWEDFLWCLHIFSLLARPLQCIGRRWAVEDSASHWPWARWQLGKAKATDEFWGFFSSSAGEFRKRKGGGKKRIDSRMRKQKFAEGHACWPVLSSFRCVSCLDLKTFFTWCKKKKAVGTLLLCNIQQYNLSNGAWKIDVIDSFAWHRQIGQPPASVASRAACR